MTRHTLTLLDEHRERLRSVLLRDANENGALLLCGRSRQVDPWTGIVEERALVRSVIEVPADAFLDRSPTSLSWSTTPLFRLAKEAMAKDYAIAIAHSHPRGDLTFSYLDDIADKESFAIVFGRMDTGRPHYSMVMDAAGDVAIRAYGPDLTPATVDVARIIGDRWAFRRAGTRAGVSLAEFDRQARAFGSRAVEDIRELRVGIVGCGGTGSAVASLLTRIGVGRLLLIDPDRVDETNLNRLHFSTRADAIAGRLKVDVVGERLAEIGLARSVIRMANFVDSVECRDALRACDIIFGCSDDHMGRNLLNRLAHFYLIPVVDLGVLITPRQDAGYDCFDGRVTVVQPGSPCQVCRKLISPRRLHEESLRRRDPALYGEYRRAGYVEGGDDPSPAVVSFTTEIAAVAVNELLHRLSGFRGPGGHCAERVRRFDYIKDADCVPGCVQNPECPLCVKRKYDGRGDMTPFLDQS